MIDALRTPDERFKRITDFDFPPTFIDDLPGYEGLRAHLIDVGPRDAERTFLCLHGEPTWCYLFRKMIPRLLHTEARVIAPDLLGFGRSDKPVGEGTYTFSFHRTFLLRLSERLDLQRITLVVQDWGGTIGLTLPVDKSFRQRLDRLFVMNTSLPAGSPLGPHFEKWRSLVRNTPDMPVGEWIAQATPGMSAAEKDAYDAPFPDRRYKSGPHTFPDLAMVRPEMDGVSEARAASGFWSEEWSGETFMAIGEQDPDRRAMDSIRRMIRDCPEPLVIPDAGHFVPEHGTIAVDAALAYFGNK